MYEDQDFWPIKCPSCGNEFTKQIGWLKSASTYRCDGGAGCEINLRHPAEEFLLALAQARNGKLDPWGNMLRLNKPNQFG